MMICFAFRSIACSASEAQGQSLRVPCGRVASSETNLSAFFPAIALHACETSKAMAPGLVPLGQDHGWRSPS